MGPSPVLGDGRGRWIYVCGRPCAFSGLTSKNSLRAISPAAYHLLIRNRWSGNVRELENAMERAVLVCKTGEIGPDDLPETLRDTPPPTDEFTLPPGHTPAMNCRQCHGRGVPLLHVDNGTECITCHR